MEIRSIKLFDIDEIEYLKPENWGNIQVFYKYYIEHDQCYPICAVKDEKIIGVANGINNGRIGWLSHIIVAPDHRRQGIGYKLVNNVNNHLLENGCKTNFLIATEDGEKLYIKAGFQVICTYLFYRGSHLKEEQVNMNIREIRKNDIEQIIEMDKYVTGENREWMLEKHLKKGYVYKSEKNSSISGFYLTDLGEGLIIANNKKAGCDLLKFKHSRSECRTVIPEKNIYAKKYLESKDFKLIYEIPRMFFGEKMKFEVDMIYSRIGGHCG